jgi:hypothetical protein
MRFASSSLRRGAATLAVTALLLFPVAGFADEGEIQFPPGAPVASPLPSAQGEIHFPPGFWGAAFLALLGAIA